MAEASPRPIGFGAALAEQLRWFWQRQRVWIVIVAVLTSSTAVLIIGNLPEDQQQVAILMVGMAFHPLMLLIALSWAFSAWRDDPPRDRQYFWLHPAPRTSHTIARSLAAGIWLIATLTVFVLVVLITTLMVQGAGAELGTPRFWIYVFAGICLAYLTASIAPVLSDRPGMWVLGLVALVVIAGAIATIREIEWLQRIVQVFNNGKYSLSTALNAPSVEAVRIVMEEQWAKRAESPEGAAAVQAEPARALLIWLPIAVAAYLGAARLSRPR